MGSQYVRREIRQLTDSDREAFFDAMETIYRLPTAEGNAQYGEEYKVGVPSCPIFVPSRHCSIPQHTVEGNVIFIFMGTVQVQGMLALFDPKCITRRLNSWFSLDPFVPFSCYL